MLIQGIGDEVISVIVAVVIIGLISLVWVSTHVQDRPLVRAVVIRSTNNPDRVLNPDGLHQIIPPAPNPQDPAELLSAIGNLKSTDIFFLLLLNKRNVYNFFITSRNDC